MTDWELADRALRKLAAFNLFPESRKNAFRLTVSEAITEARLGSILLRHLRHLLRKRDQTEEATDDE
jgi:hypothetical protein